MSYSNDYQQMSSVEKDRLCDGGTMNENLNRIAKQHPQQNYQQNNFSCTKRPLSSNDFDDHRNSPKQQRVHQNNGNDKMQSQQQRPKLLPRRLNDQQNNSSFQHQDSPILTTNSTINEIGVNPNQDNRQQNQSNFQYLYQKTWVSKHALDYASEYHYLPFKIECQPKINDKKKGQTIVNELIKFIKDDFMKQNPSFSRTLMFDLWWMDSNGDLQIIIKTTEFYVYLCKIERYPAELCGVKMIPHHPNHLPPQNTVILKWVSNSISNSELKDELLFKYKSVHSIEEMSGAITHKTRHVKVELLNAKDCDSILNSGKISIFGHLITAEEYLPAPKLLICSRCNQPGHTKTTCRNSQFDVCRRCGGDRSNRETHKECAIRCHNCNGNHLSTDNECEVIKAYRQKLIDYLKRNPERLPPATQLFIPIEYRQHDRIKIISNPIAKDYNCQPAAVPNRNDFNAWPNANPTSATTTATTTTLIDINNKVDEAIKNVSERIKEIEQRYEEKQKRNENELHDLQEKMENRLKTNMLAFSQAVTVMQQSHQIQNNVFNKMITSFSMLTNIFTNNTMQIHTLLTYLNKENSNNNDIKEMLQETKQYKITVEGMNSDFKNKLLVNMRVYQMHKI